MSELIEHEMAVREGAKRARLFRRAKFPQVKSFEGYDFSQVAFPDGYGLDDLKSLSFVEAAQDFVFHGQTGRGKDPLRDSRPAHACVMAGKAVRFYKSSLTFSFGSKSYPPVTCCQARETGRTSVL